MPIKLFIGKHKRTACDYLITCTFISPDNVSQIHISSVKFLVQRGRPYTTTLCSDYGVLSYDNTAVSYYYTMFACTRLHAIIYTYHSSRDKARIL